MFVVCVGLGWIVESARRQRAVVSWVEKTGGFVTYSYQMDRKKTGPPAPEWMIHHLGIDFFDRIVRVDMPPGTKVDDLSPLSGLAELKILYLNNTSVADLSPLSRVTSLERLGVEGTDVSDVASLAHLKRLRFLQLGNTPISDVTPLAGLANLNTLKLADTQVSDVTPLGKLTNLNWLELDGTRVRELTAQPPDMMTRRREAITFCALKSIERTPQTRCRYPTKK